jgi:hypothetical protein
MNERICPKVLIILVFLVYFLRVLVPSAHAQQKEYLEVNPAYVDISIGEPDTSKKVTVSYKNTGSVPLTLEIFPIDFKQTADSGQISFLGSQSGTYSYSLSSFLSFDKNILEVAPHSTEKVTVTITNRPDLSPGGHYAAVVARDTSQRGDTVISPALSSLFFIRKIGGERYNLSVRNVSWPRYPVTFIMPTRFDITFQNEGNVHVIPYGRIEVRDMLGRLTHKGIVNTDSLFVFPETRRIINAKIQQVSMVFPIMIYSISIKGTDSLKKINYVHTESFIYIQPVSLIVFVLLIMIFLWYRKRRKAKRRQKV